MKHANRQIIHRAKHLKAIATTSKRRQKELAKKRIWPVHNDYCNCMNLYNTLKKSGSY